MVPATEAGSLGPQRPNQLKTAIFEDGGRKLEVVFYGMFHVDNVMFVD